MSSNEVNFNMNSTIAESALQRYFTTKDIAASSRSSYKSSLNTLIRLKLLDEFERPEVYFDKLAVTEKKEGKPYSESHVNRFCKVMSNIAHHMTKEEKVAAIQKRNRQDAGTNPLKKKMKFSNEQLLLQFTEKIHDHYKAYNYGAYMEYKHGNSTQAMTEKQTKAYQKHQVLVDKVLGAIAKLGDLKTARKIYYYQFLVVALIYLLADRNRRLDIGDTMMEDGDDVRVVLRDDGIHIKETNKTYEKSVMLTFTDQRLKDAVAILAKYRRDNNKKYLFLKQDGDRASDKSWFGNSFKSIMSTQKIGEGLTMGVFRMAYGIMLSEKHDGTVLSQEHIEDAMGHSWEVHQRRYNLNALDNVENVDADAESDDEA